MIAIINEAGDMQGVCQYRLQVNEKVIARFEHTRADGLAECLRKAAFAVDKKKEEFIMQILKESA